MTNLIVGIIITMIFSAFFSGMEIAFVSSNRLRAEMEREKNGLADKAISFFYRHPNDFVSTMLVGNNIALVVYGILFAAIFDNTLFASLNDGSRVTADTLLSTVIVLFTGEFLPKTIFKASPNTMLRFFAVPTMACYVTLFPISRFATVLSKGLLRLSGQKIDNDSADKAFTKVDLDYLVQTSIDNAPDEQQIEEVKIFHNALDFSDTKVRDCMVPRTEIESVDIEKASMDQLKSRFIESGHSKIVVYREDIDHVIGYVHSSDLFRIGAKIVGEDPIPSSMIREMPYVPETMAASKLMHTFLQEKKSLAVVIDEFGGTSGLVSLEDIVEEIFGDIEDEHDNMHYVAKQLGEGEYMLSARLEIEKVNEMFSLDLPESDDYMTVGGLILHEYQSFPKLNEVVKIGHFEFKIVKNTMTKIELVRLKVEE
ncbi:hemolysin [Prevotella sp. P4-98]|uniref:hemolysin family protein n=1 Tax=Prevotella sp. P4-98 TaxID=2024219 RepID=UPI000B96AC9D|nr:hemolysin family protein [Prevotella sp. P4-98]OYP48432.1 hemolysin [Prevotella sp. P4-98]